MENFQDKVNFFNYLYKDNEGDVLVNKKIKIKDLLILKENIKNVDDIKKEKIYRMMKYFKGENIDDYLEDINKVEKINDIDIEDIYCIMSVFNENIENSLKIIKEKNLYGIGEKFRGVYDFNIIRESVLKEVINKEEKYMISVFLEYDFGYNFIKENFVKVIKNESDNDIKHLLLKLDKFYKSFEFKEKVKKEDMLLLWNKEYLKRDNKMWFYDFCYGISFFSYSFLVNFIDKVKEIDKDTIIFIDDYCIDEEGNIKYKISDKIKRIEIISKKIKKISNLPEDLEELKIFDANSLETLERCPRRVKKFSLQNLKKLKNLIGCPEEVDDLEINYSKLESFENSFKKVKKIKCYFIEGVKDLVGCPSEVEHFKCVNFRDLESLKGCPKSIESFECLYNWKLKDLTDLPNNENTEIIITTNNYLSKNNIDKYVKENKIKSKIKVNIEENNNI